MTVNWGMIAPSPPQQVLPQIDVAGSFFKGQAAGLAKRQADRQDEAFEWDRDQKIATLFGMADTPAAHAAVLRALGQRGYEIPEPFRTFEGARAAAQSWAGPQLLDLQHRRAQIDMMGAQMAQMRLQTPEAREAMARRFGLTPGTPDFNFFVLNGQLPQQRNPLLQLLQPPSPQGGGPPAQAPAAAADAPLATGARMAFAPGATGAAVMPAPGAAPLRAGTTVGDAAAPLVAAAASPPPPPVASQSPAGAPASWLHARIAQLSPQEQTKLYIAASANNLDEFNQILFGTGKAFDEATQRAAAARVVEGQKTIATASQSIADIDRVTPLVQQAFTGSGARWRQAVAEALASVGWMDEGTASATQQLDMFLRQMIGKEADKYKPISNSDIAWIEKTLPNLTQTPETITRALAIMRRAGERQILFERLLAQNPTGDHALLLRQVDQMAPQLTAGAPGAAVSPAAPRGAGQGQPANARWAALADARRLEAIARVRQGAATAEQFQAHYGISIEEAEQAQRAPAQPRRPVRGTAPGFEALMEELRADPGNSTVRRVFADRFGRDVLIKALQEIGVQR